MGLSTISSLTCDWPECENSEASYEIPKNGKGMTFPSGWMNMDIYPNCSSEDRVEGDDFEGVICPKHAAFFMEKTNEIEPPTS